jgi:hypothetical protein
MQQTIVITNLFADRLTLIKQCNVLQSHMFEFTLTTDPNHISEQIYDIFLSCVDEIYLHMKEKTY